MRRALAAWYESARRDLPWRRTSDPYRIWLSEIMLQQTRVAAVIPYYERFLARFPDAEALAAADEPALLAAWSGLGYYSRARNLHRAAREIAASGFPDTYEGWLALPGIGGYTAAAVTSIAYGQPHAVVDGNVLRVLARLTGDASDIGAPKTRARFQGVAQEFLEPAAPGVHNQAVMELGATICTPRAPRCPVCPLKRWCSAYRDGRQHELPVKMRERKKVEVALEAYVIERGGALLLWRRENKEERMAGFWELPDAARAGSATSREKVGNFTHTILHFHHRIEVFRAKARSAPEGCEWVPIEKLNSFPVSTIAKKALDLAGTFYKS